MSNNGTQALSLALEQAEKQRDAALAASQRAGQALEAAQAQARQLQDYRNDYQARWSAQFKLEGQVEILHCYQSFMSRINQAIDLQQSTLVKAEQQAEEARTVLLERETRVAAIGKMIARRLASEQHAQNVRDQKSTDEQATRLAWSRRHDDGLGGPSYALA